MPLRGCASAKALRDCREAVEASPPLITHRAACVVVDGGTLGSMPALPIIANTIRTTFNWKNQSSGQVVAHNVMHFSKSGGTPTQLWTLLEASWQANQTGWMPNTFGLDSYDFLPLDGSSATTHINSGVNPIGQNTGDAIPAAAAVVKLRTGLRGRSHRGRIFLPYVNEARQSSGVLDSTTVTQGQTAWNGWLAAMIAGSWPLQVASYVLGTAAPVTSIVYETKLGTMRRRQDKVRRS